MSDQRRPQSEKDRELSEEELRDTEGGVLPPDQPIDVLFVTRPRGGSILGIDLETKKLEQT